MSNEKLDRPITIILKNLPPNYEWTVHVPGSGGDHKLDPVDPGDAPTPPTTVEVEVHKKNPRWVKVGDEWFFIG